MIATLQGTLATTEPKTNQMSATEPRKSDTRLIERWLPIAEIGIESLRERTPMTPFPAPNRLHVWWARRPLVASRAAILASLLPADADQNAFRHVLGIHGDPVASRRRIDQARRSGVRFEGEAYSYGRAFQFCPTTADRAWLRETANLSKLSRTVVLDPTAGGGSIPLEAARLGLNTVGNDLNPVAAIIQRATVEWPIRLGMEVHREFLRIAEQFVAKREQRLKALFEPEPEAYAYATNYLWARTVRCPYCDGVVPLSPNWRLASDGKGIRILADIANGANTPNRRCSFQVVNRVSDHSLGTIASGDATCPFPDCGRVISGDEVKRQAQALKMGEQMYAVVFKRRVEMKTKNGKARWKWVRAFRSARPQDENLATVAATIADRLPEWEALDRVPNEAIGDLTNYERGHRLYGVTRWREMFSPRQLLCHGTGVELFLQLLEEERANAPLTEVTKAAFCYLALTLDSFLNYINRSARWDVVTERVRSIFDRHGFAFLWSYAEMSPLIESVGYDWIVDKTAECIKELVELTRPHEARAADTAEFDFCGRVWSPPPITLTNESGESLYHLPDASVDCVVMDPPYYDNVMYAELSDFFYVWLKRTAGHVLPELFRRQLTDKENEAVANVAKFRDQKGAKALAGRDYQERMAAIFAECRRVLKPDGIMTLMFTHKATGAWDALTKGLMEAHFTITASWPINTEAEGSLHIKDKAAANSTIFLACRPRATEPIGTDTRYWEDVEPLVAQAVRDRVAEFQQSGIRGVDLYLACFGPALQKFSEFWPLTRGTPKPRPASRRAVQKQLWEEAWDPYAVSPEDALDAARREVKRWRLEQLTHKRALAELDSRTSWFVLAWDAFQAPVFPYDEALRLARAVGVDLDKEIVGSLCEKKGSDLTMWDSAKRAAKSALGGADGSSGMVDALHHAAHQARTKTVEAGRELLERAGVLTDPNLATAMQAVLEVLPVGTAFSKVELPTDVAGAGNDFDALEKLRRLAFTDRVEPPEQLELWTENARQ